MRRRYVGGVSHIYLYFNNRGCDSAIFIFYVQSKTQFAIISIMNIFFAHAGEEHADTISSSTHLIQQWYIAVPLFIGVVATIGYLTWLVSNRNRHVTLGVITLLLLIIGFTAFQLSPVVSIMAILIGLACSLFAAFTSITS